jgi:hypothetical protein
MAGISLLSYYTLLIDVAMKVFMVMMFLQFVSVKRGATDICIENDKLKFWNRFHFQRSLYNEVVRGPITLLCFFKNYFNPASFETYVIFSVK